MITGSASGGQRQCQSRQPGLACADPRARLPLLPPLERDSGASISQTQECPQASSRLDGSSPACADRASAPSPSLS